MNASLPICTLSMRDIIDIAADFFGVSVVDIISPRRHASITDARNAAMYAIRELLPRSYPEIARAFGDRDHTSVMHACRTVTRKLLLDPKYAARINTFLTLLRERKSLTQADQNPFLIAQQIVDRPRLAAGISVNTIRDFAAIVVAALSEATRQEREAEEKETELAKLREFVAQAGPSASVPQQPEVVITRMHPLEQPLLDFVSASFTAETASPAHQRTANANADKAHLALQFAAEKHFNITRTFR